MLTITNVCVYSYQDYQLLSPIQTTLRFIPLGIVGREFHFHSYQVPLFTSQWALHLAQATSFLEFEGTIS